MVADAAGLLVRRGGVRRDFPRELVCPLRNHALRQRTIVRAVVPSEQEEALHVRPCFLAGHVGHDKIGQRRLGLLQGAQAKLHIVVQIQKQWLRIAAGRIPETSMLETIRIRKQRPACVMTGSISSEAKNCTLI